MVVGMVGCGDNNSLKECLQDIYGRLRQNEVDNKALKEDNILIKERLGIRETQNGERKEQLKIAQDRINEVGSKAEEGDKNLFEKIDELQKYLVDLIITLFIILFVGTVFTTIFILFISKMLV